MTRAIITLNWDSDRAKAKEWVAKAPPGTAVEFRAAKRSSEQNNLMWSLLGQVAEQCEHNGRKYKADQWKILFLHAIGQEVQFIPSLDGSTFIPWGMRSSELTKSEMGELIDFIFAWGAQRGIRFREYETESAA